MPPFRRLFNEHWGVTLVLGALWFIVACVAMVGPEDSRHPNYGPTLLFLSAMIVLVSFAWANSRHYQQVESMLKRRSLTWTTALLDLVVFVVLFSIPAAILAAAYGKYTIRARMGEMVSAAGALKLPIEEAAAEKQTLKGAGTTIRTGTVKNADYLQVGPDGVIVAYNERHGTILVLTPTMSEGKVNWRCQGYPEQFFPRSCRGAGAK